jgi:signal transduction histidine kinase
MRARLQDGLELVEYTLQSVRALSTALRPSVLDDLGLVSALRWLLDQQARLGGFRGTLSADPPELRLAPELETTCFRIAQEALHNVVRHAQASQVVVELRRRDTLLELSIRDDGKGFDVRAALERAMAGHSLGILSLQERAALFDGELKIVSAPGQGTEVRAVFPLDRRENGA